MYCRENSSTVRRKYWIIGVLLRGIMHEGARGHAINVCLSRDARRYSGIAFPARASELPRIVPRGCD